MGWAKLRTAMMVEYGGENQRLTGELAEKNKPSWSGPSRRGLRSIVKELGWECQTGGEREHHTHTNIKTYT